MILFNEEKDIVCFQNKALHEMPRLMGTFQGYDLPSKELLIHYLEDEIKAIPYDSVGVYDKSTNKALAMFYPDREWDKKYQGKISSTHYTDPYKTENWEILIDERAYAEGQWGTFIGFIKFTLKKTNETPQ